MWNFFTGYFLGQSSSSDEKSGCSGIILGVVGLFVIFYAIKWTAAIDSYLARIAEDKGIIAYLLYPYLIQQLHHISGTSALWISFICMIVGAVCILFSHGFQEHRQLKGVSTYKLLFAVVRLYLYLMIIYQTVYGGKILWESSLFKTIGWYILGFGLICFIRGLTMNSAQIKRPSVGRTDPRL